MNDIETNKETLIIVDVQYAKIVNVEKVVKNPDNTVSVVFNEGEGWKDFYFTLLSLKYKEPHSFKDFGNLFKQSLTFTHPGDGYDFSGFLNYHYIVKFQYQNGKEKIIGDMENPALFKIDFEQHRIVIEPIIFGRIR